MGGGGKGGTSTSTVKIPPEVLKRYNAVNKRAEALASRPFQEYNGQFVAGINAQQQAGIEGINNAANAGQGYFNEAGGLMRAGSGNAMPGQLDINRYLSPYTENVVEATQRTQENQNRQQAQQLAGNAISQGAFGGDRAGISQANLAGQQSLANQQTLAGLRQQGYTQALGAAQQQQGLGYQADTANLARRLQAGQGLAGLGAQAQTSGLQGAQAQIGAGTLQQQTEQADLSAKYNQFLQQQGYDFQIAQFLANIAMGTGALSGSTTTNTQPTSFFSDERLKEDIKPIGKTFDGQPIYSYKMKGDPRTQIGLLAQEVEGRHPEAVGLARGYKTVDYDKATEHAAHRGHFYRGGLASSAGGGVGYGNAGEGFADGGVPIGGDIYQILAAQKAMFPYQAAGLYGGQMGAGPHGIGMSAPDLGDLTRAFDSRKGTPPARQESGFKQALNTGEQIANTYDKGQKMYEGANRALYGSPASAENKNKPTVGLLGSGGGEGTEPGYARQAVDAVRNFAGNLFEGPRARGGLVRAHYDMGGAMPYAQAQGSPLEDVLKEQKDSAPDAPKASAPGEAGPSGFQQALGTGAQIASIASLFSGSDRRLKEDIEPIGKTFDGQVIHKYRYKGDSRTQIGLIAQEVERHHPDAVGLAKGFKTVNYDTATKDAANRGHFGYGGLAGRNGYGPGGTPEALPEWNDEVRKRITRSEGTDLPNNAGYDARYGYDKYPAPDKPLSQMTLGEVSNYQRDKLIPATRGQIPGVPKTQGTGAVGAYQMTHGFINQYAPEFFGPNYRDETFFTPENQDALAEFVYNKYKNDPKKLAGTWATFSGLDPQGAGRALEVQQGRNTVGADGSINVGRVPEPVPRDAQMPVEKPSGLAGAALEQGAAPPPEGGVAGPQKAEKPFGYPLRKNPDWMQRNQEWVLPLASGIGSMLASNSPFLANAIGEGLVGAAGGYGEGQNRLSEMEERAAGTEKTFADIASEGIFTLGNGYAVRYKDPVTGEYKVMPGYEWIEKDPADRPPVDARAEAMIRAKPGTPEGAATLDVAKDAIGASLPEDYRQLAAENVRTQTRAGFGTSTGPTQTDVFTPVEKDYSSAVSLRPQLMQLWGELASQPRTGALSPGAGLPAVKAFVSGLNGVAQRLGVSMGNAEELATLQDLRKQINSLKIAASEKSDFSAVSVLDDYAATLPDEINTPEGQAKMMAGILVANRRAIDKGELYNKFRRYASNLPNGASAAPYSGNGLEALYTRDHSPAQYVREKQALERLYNSTPPESPDTTWAQIISEHADELSKHPEQVKKLEEALNAPGIFRYFR